MVDLRDEPKAATPASGAALGLRQAIALIVGCIIGVSIFNLPYSLASIGPISLVEMVLTTIGALALALMFAALSTRLPAGGGPYAHVLAAFGNGVGFVNAVVSSRLLDPVHRVLAEWRPGAPVREPQTVPHGRGRIPAGNSRVPFPAHQDDVRPPVPPVT